MQLRNNKTGKMDSIPECKPHNPSVFVANSSDCENVSVHATFVAVLEPDDDFSLITFKCPFTQESDYAEFSMVVNAGNGKISYGIGVKETLLQTMAEECTYCNVCTNKTCKPDTRIMVCVNKTSTGITMKINEAPPTKVCDNMPESGVFFVCFKNASGSIILKSECMSGVCWTRDPSDSDTLKPGSTGGRVITQSYNPNQYSRNQTRQPYNQNRQMYSSRGPYNQNRQTPVYHSRGPPQQTPYNRNSTPPQSKFNQFADRAGSDIKQFAHSAGIEMGKFGRATERDAERLGNKAREIYADMKKKETSAMVSSSETLGNDFAFNSEAPVERQTTAIPENTPSITWDGLVNLLSIETLDSVAANSIDDESCRIMTTHGKGVNTCVIKLCPLGEHSLYLMQINNFTDVPLYIDRFHIGQIIAVVGDNPLIKIQTGTVEHKLIQLPHNCLFAIDLDGADLGTRAATAIIEKNEEISLIVSNEDILKASFSYTDEENQQKFIVPPMESLTSQY